MLQHLPDLLVHLLPVLQAVAQFCLLLLLLQAIRPNLTLCVLSSCIRCWCFAGCGAILPAGCCGHGAWRRFRRCYKLAA
jgi:hypothetical protein